MSGYPHTFGNERDVLFRALVMYNLVALCLCYLRSRTTQCNAKKCPSKNCSRDGEPRLPYLSQKAAQASAPSLQFTYA